MFLRLCWRAPRMRMGPWDMSAVFPEESNILDSAPGCAERRE
jgi:hypothetical protein